MSNKYGHLNYKQWKQAVQKHFKMVKKLCKSMQHAKLYWVSQCSGHKTKVLQCITQYRSIGLEHWRAPCYLIAVWSSHCHTPPPHLTCRGVVARVVPPPPTQHTPTHTHKHSHTPTHTSTHYSCSSELFIIVVLVAASLVTSNINEYPLGR